MLTGPGTLGLATGTQEHVVTNPKEPGALHWQGKRFGRGVRADPWGCAEPGVETWEESPGCCIVKLMALFAWEPEEYGSLSSIPEWVWRLSLSSWLDLELTKITGTFLITLVEAKKISPKCSLHFPLAAYMWGQGRRELLPICLLFQCWIYLSCCYVICFLT